MDVIVSRTKSYRIEPRPCQDKESGVYDALILEGPTATERVIAAFWFKSEASAHLWAKSMVETGNPIAIAEKIVIWEGWKPEWSGQEQAAADLYNHTVKPVIDRISLDDPGRAAAASQWAGDPFLALFNAETDFASEESKNLASSFAERTLPAPGVKPERCSCGSLLDHFGEDSLCRNLLCDRDMAPFSRWASSYVGYGILAIAVGACGLFVLQQGPFTHMSQWVRWLWLGFCLFMLAVGGVSITLHYTTKETLDAMKEDDGK